MLFRDLCVRESRTSTTDQLPRTEPVRTIVGEEEQRGRGDPCGGRDSSIGSAVPRLTLSQVDQCSLGVESSKGNASLGRNHTHTHTNTTTVRSALFPSKHSRATEEHAKGLGKGKGIDDDITLK